MIWYKPELRILNWKWQWYGHLTRKQIHRQIREKETRRSESHTAAYDFQHLWFCLLTCGHVVAGSVPGWCCKRWRPVWGWCCTRPPPPQSCYLAGHATVPATVAASPPWSLTEWRPWHWGREVVQQSEESRWESLAAGVFLGSRAGGWIGWEASWQTQTLAELTVRRGENITSSSRLHLRRRQQSRADLSVAKIGIHIQC